jgi:hypothetical protein
MNAALALLFFTTAIPPLTSSLLLAQDHKTAPHPDFGFVNVRREPVEWPAPENLVAQLHSSDEHVRLDALRLIGLTDTQAYHPVWTQSSPSEMIGQKVFTPGDIRLMYAALGRDSTQQAVIAVLDTERQGVYAAIGIPAARGWKRVATFDCWCKYEMYSGQDTIAESVQLKPAPQSSSDTSPHSELVLRASGGGTGVYSQNQIHFRIRDGQLVDVLSFVSRYRNGCETKPSCEHLEARWFDPSLQRDGPGGVLVTAQGDFNPATVQEVDWKIRALEIRQARITKCQSYEWNEAAFRYRPRGKETSCPN